MAGGLSPLRRDISIVFYNSCGKHFSDGSNSEAFVFESKKNTNNPLPFDLKTISTMGSIIENAPLGKEFTQKVVDAMGPNTPPRLREIMSSLIRHLHEFTIETQLTTDEWMLGVNTINWAGQMSDDKRNEGQLMCDVLGIES
jgi:hypothetical protein